MEGFISDRYVYQDSVCYQTQMRASFSVQLSTFRFLVVLQSQNFANIVSVESTSRMIEQLTKQIEKQDQKMHIMNVFLMLSYKNVCRCTCVYIHVCDRNLKKKFLIVLREKNCIRCGYLCTFAVYDTLLFVTYLCGCKQFNSKTFCHECYVNTNRICRFEYSV